MNKRLCSTYVISSLFSKEEVQKILSYLETVSLVPATVATTASASQAQPRVRKGNVTWIPDSEANHWVYERIMSGFTEANDALFDFEFTNLQEIQYIKYSPFHYFRSHFDCSTDVTSRRKLGISIQLSESSGYLGGAMKVEAAEGTITLPRGAGDALIFPPYLKHQAKTVYLGSRHCLVTWVESERSFR